MRVLGLALAVILVSAVALVSSQIVQEVSVNFNEYLTLTCDLTAHSDLVAQRPVNISWESMGKDVVQYDGTLHIGPLFKNRTKAVWEDGKLTFMLTPVVLSDSDVYECLWHGWKTLSTVIVTVLDTLSEEATVFGFVNSHIQLPCFGKISKSRTLEKVSVYWKNNGKIIYSLAGGKPTFAQNNTAVNLHRIHEYGDLSLFINNLSLEDSGTYECLYRDNNFGAEVHGTPKFTTLILSEVVNPTEIEPFDVNSTIPSTTPSGTPSSYPTTIGITTTTEQEEMDLQTVELSTEMQLTFPGFSVPETSPGTEETLPWVRIGIICGVLIVTALVLGPLVALGKI